ncbi:MAG: hypothetical protein SGPRY_008966, partial [Prymnesium sp.]
MAGEEVAVWLGVPLAFLLAFSNGANDIANSMGTIVGARSLSLSRALLAGAACEFLGALAIGPFVASNIASGQVHTDAFDKNALLLAFVMLSALAGAASTTLLATLYGYPISATHGIISGILATSLASALPNALNTSGLTFTLLGWVASPLVGMLAGMLVSGGLHHLITTSQDPRTAATSRQPLLLALTVAVSLLFLLLKGPPLVTHFIGRRYWLAVILALLGGCLVSVVHFCVQQWASRRACRFDEEESSKREKGESSVKLDDFSQSEVQSEVGSPGTALARETSRVFEDLEQPFVPLLIVAGLTVALAHGANDVGNAVGPLAVLLDIAETRGVQSTSVLPTWGILALGSRTILTVGSQITALTPQRSFASQIGAGVAVLSSS